MAQGFHKCSFLLGVKLVTMAYPVSVVPICKLQVPRKTERVRMILYVEDMVIMVSCNVMYSHLLLQTDNLLHDVPVFQKYPEASRLHMSTMSPANQVRGFRIRL